LLSFYSGKENMLIIQSQNGTVVGGQKYISDLFQISTYRIRTGIKELNNPHLLDEIPEGKQRRKGGGRKKKKLVPLK